MRALTLAARQPFGLTVLNANSSPHLSQIHSFKGFIFGISHTQTFRVSWVEPKDPPDKPAQRICDRNCRVRSSRASVKKVAGGPCSTITPWSVK
jgi:hypothetical protein